MAGEGGFLYEGRVHNRLKKGKLVPRGFKPGGAESNAPDASFIYGGRPYLLEVKLDLSADYGQGTLEYNNGIWQLGGAPTVAAEELRGLMRASGIEQFANAEWGSKGAPFKGRVATEEFTSEMVTSDYTNFNSRYKVVPSSVLHSYYAAKNTYYIQIGDYGMYYLAANPANLPVPQFNPSLKIRIRTKRSGSYPLNNYRFTTALQITGRPPRSKFDIDKSVEFLQPQ